MTNTNHEADVAFIKALAELLRENDLTELQVKRDYGEDDSLNVRVSRAAPAPVVAAAPQQVAVAPAAAPAAAAPAVAAPAADAGEDPASHPGAVLSPMVLCVKGVGRGCRGGRHFSNGGTVAPNEIVTASRGRGHHRPSSLPSGRRQWSRRP